MLPAARIPIEEMGEMRVMNHNAEVSVETGRRGLRTGERLPGRRARGSSLIEFALVMTFLLVPTTVGLAEFATYLANYLALTDAVATGARALAINRGTQNPCNVVAPIITAAYQASAIESAGTPSLTFKITLTPKGGSATSVTWTGATTPTTPANCYSASTAPLTGMAGDLSQGGTATVFVNFSPTLIFNVFNLTIPITAQTTEIVQ